MPARGTFTVRGPIDQILDKLVQACAELKAKVSRIDKEKNEIYGKSKSTWLKWGSEFQVRLVKGPSDVMVVVEDLARVPNDLFIRDLHAKFSKHTSCSPLQISIVDRALGDSKLDKRKDLVMQGEGAPEMVADIPDDFDKKLPQARVCKKCGASNPADNDYCGSCG